MNDDISFGSIIKDYRKTYDLTQAELARRVGCATITVRKIEADALRPSVQIAERLAMALNVPLDERAKFVRLARTTILNDPSPSPLPTPPLIPDEVGLEDLSGRAIRGYELGERLAMGGFGAVYRSVQPLLDREVAIKIILPQYANHPEFIRRFEAEAQLVARLEHPYIVPLYDFWREPGVAYLVMRLMRGGSLHGRLKGGPLSLEAAVRLLQQVGTALHNAHRVGVVHRDIKPANILLDDDDNAYLADFGFAKNLGNPNFEEQTQDGAVVGSLEYISPEQIQAEPIRPQADIYCLGITLYEMLTGRKPFKGPTPIDFIQQHLREPLPSLASGQNGPPDKKTLAALDPVIARATHKNPDLRYPDVLALLEDVHHSLSSDPAANTASGQLPSAILSLPALTLENPYKGLRAFGEADADNFFGRETLTQELLGRLSESTDLARFLAVVGPSGSGKSSLVKASLTPALRRGGLPGSENWFIVDFMPGPHPLEELEAALLRVATNPPNSLLTQLRDSDRGLLRALKRILPVDDSVELVLVIDQFEELFTLVDDETERLHFLDLLVTTLLEEHSRLRVVITLRADFIDRPLQYADFGEMLRQRTEFVLPLSADELEQAITQPSTRLGLTWESGLVATIINEVSDQPGTLPLLQYTLTELFERRDGRRLTMVAYQDSGGVLGTLANRAEEIYAGLDEAGHEIARQLFLRLVTPGEGTEDTRRRVLRSELASLTKDESRKTNGVQNDAPSSSVLRLASVLDLFGKHRLLTFDRDPVTRTSTVEVAHEALIREWGRLRAWLDESRTDIRMQRQLATTAAEWRDADQDASFLLRGTRLSQFAAWAETTTLALTPDERAFLEASLSDRQLRRAEEELRRQRELEAARRLAETERARAEEQSRAAGKLRQRAVYLTGALLIAGLLAVAAAVFGQQASQNAAAALAEANTRATAQAVAEVQQKEAERQARLAISRELAAASVKNLDVDPELSILLALQSITTTYTADDELVLPEALEALHQAIPASRVRLTLAGHTAPVYLGIFSPDGTRLATSDFSGVSKVWDAATGQELFTLSGGDAAFSLHDGGKYLVTVSPGKITTITTWEVTSGQMVNTLPVQVDTEEKGFLLTPDWTRLIVVEPDGTISVWDATVSVPQPVPLFRLVGHTDDLTDMAFSPDGTRWATASNDETARIWDAGTGKLLFTLTGHTLSVKGVTFSPDGRYLATFGNSDSTVKVWDVATGKERFHFVAGGSGDIAFSPDGVHLATVQNTLVKVWDLTKVLQTDLLPASNSDVTDTVFNKDLWLEGHPGSILGVAFNSAGTHLISAGRDGTARVWDISPAGAKEWLTLAGHSGDWLINDIAFSPDGSRLATASGDSSAKVWDAATGQEFLTLVGHTASLVEVTFSPDGTRLATASEDQTAKVWDAFVGQELLTLAGHTDLLTDVAFSPDGTRLATTSDDQTVKIWNAATGQELLTLTAHTDFVQSVAFSPNGTRLATGSGDSTAKIWDGLTGREIFTLTGHTDTVNDVAFSPDGSRLATGSFDGTVKIWQVATGQELFSLSRDQYTLWEVAFNPDGTRLAAASWGDRVIVWDISDANKAGTTHGNELLTLPGSGNSVAFSPDGRLLATGGIDKTARVYLLPINELISLAQSRVTRSLTEAECRQYLHLDHCPGE